MQILELQFQVLFYSYHHCYGYKPDDLFLNMPIINYFDCTISCSFDLGCNIYQCFYLLLFLKSDLLASFLHHHIRIKGKIGVLFLQRGSLLLAWSKHFAILWFKHNQKHKQDQYIIANFGCILVEFRVSSSYHCLSTNCRRVSFLWFCDPWNTPRTSSTTHLKQCPALIFILVAISIISTSDVICRIDQSCCMISATQKLDR